MKLAFLTGSSFRDYLRSGTATDPAPAEGRLQQSHANHQRHRQRYRRARSGNPSHRLRHAAHDAKSAYADGARTSNAIMAAVKQAGVDRDRDPQRIAVPRSRLDQPSSANTRCASSGPSKSRRSRRRGPRCCRQRRSEQQRPDRLDRKGRKGSRSPGARQDCLTGQGKCRSARQGHGCPTRLADLRQQPSLTAPIPEASHGWR